MHTSNLCTNVGVFNGILGVVEQMMYDLGSWPLNPPTYVLVRSDNYVGIHGMKYFLGVLLLHLLK